MNGNLSYKMLYALIELQCESFNKQMVLPSLSCNGGRSLLKDETSTNKINKLENGAE
jgi:hypothetical protein